MSKTKNQQTIENALIGTFHLTKDPNLVFSFTLLDNNTLYSFIPTHNDAKPWIMKVIRCWREKETISFSYDEDNGGVSNIFLED